MAKIKENKIKLVQLLEKHGIMNNQKIITKDLLLAWCLLLTKKTKF